MPREEAGDQLLSSVSGRSGERPELLLSCPAADVSLHSADFGGCLGLSSSDEKTDGVYGGLGWVSAAREM